MTKAHFEKLEKMYLAANVNTQIFDTTTCNIFLEKAEIGLTISEKYFHALGAMHGSVYFKLLDDAAFFAVNSVVEDVFVLTKSFEIQLFRPINNGMIKAVGKLTSKSTDQFIATSVLYDASGIKIAQGKGTFVRSKVVLCPEIGYK